MRQPPHPYLQFRRRLARHALLQFFASFKSSLEIVVAVFGPVLLGLLAFIALPSLYAVTLPWPAMLAVLAAQAVLSAAPAWLLRQRLLPHDVLHWCLPLPVPARLEWRACAAVAAMLMRPLAMAYAVSLGVWLYQWPAWLRPVVVGGVAATVLSLLLTWGLVIVLLARRRPAALRQPFRVARKSRPDPAGPPLANGTGGAGGHLAGAFAHSGTAATYAPRRHRLRLLFLWRLLFWLPFWRAENRVGLQQTVMFVVALVSTALWLAPLPRIAGGMLAFSSSALLVLLTDRGDKAVREQIALLRPEMANWPVATRGLEQLACSASLVPALVLLAAGALLLALHGGHYSHRAALFYLATATLAQAAIVGLPMLSARGRVGLLVVAILVLTAIGSELWI